MSILIGFTCALLGGFLLAVPSPRKLPNRFLAAFLFLTAIELSVWIWGGIQSQPDWVSGVWFAIGKLQMPAFFFFFMSSCYSDFRLKPHDVLHLIPFGLTLSFNLFLVKAVGANPLADIFSAGSAASIALSHIIYYAYLTAIVAILWRFRQRFRLHHSGGRSEVLLWLTQLAAVSLFAHTLVLIRDAVRFTSASDAVLVLQMIGALLALAITTWIALKSLLQPDLFRDVDRRLLQLKAAPASLPDSGIKRVVDFVEAQKPYLNSDLNLADLAHQVAMTAREVSELLNGSLGVHFFDFVNGYRVEYAKTLLLDTPKRSIIQVLHDSGFNSKSSFNTAFKKHAGLTPSAFRVQVVLSSAPSTIG